MAQTIKLKRSATPGAIPSLESLELGEIAINTYDGKVYIKKDDGTSPDTIVDITGTGGLAGGDFSFLDNEKAIFGTGSDLQIYHDGSDSYISDQGTGNLIIDGSTSTQIKGSSFVILRSSAGENMAVGNANGAFDLYYDGSKKLATTATGIDVTGSVTADGLTVETSAEPALITLRHTGNTSGLLIRNFSGGEAQLVNVDNGPMVFKTNDTERLRIDAGGSVLIGKPTPTDLHNTWNHIIIGEKGAIISQNGAGGIDGITLSDNAYIDTDTGNYAYQTAAAASLIRQSGGVTTFSNAASGSAGDALTPVPRMTIDASGNVGIGPNNPQTSLHLSKTTTGPIIRLENSTNGIGENVLIGGIEWFNSDTSGEGPNVVSAIESYSASSLGNDGYLTFSTYDSAESDVEGQRASEKMRITADGKVGIGTTSPKQKVHSTNGFYTTGGIASPGTPPYTSYSGASFDWFDGYARLASWGADATTRGGYSFIQMQSDGESQQTAMTIDASGKVGIGTNSPSFKLHVSHDVGGNATFTGGILVENTGTTTGEANLVFKNQDTGSNYWFTGLNQDTNYALSYGPTFEDPSNLFTLTSGGNLGVGGDPDPDERLVVTGSANGGSTAIVVQNEYSLASSVDESTDLQFRFYSAQSDIYTSGAMIRSTKTEDWMTTAAASAELVFYTREDNVLAPRMTILPSGNVGIGKTSPGYALDVRSSSEDTARFSNSAGVDTLVRIIAGDYNTELDARLFIGENDDAGMTFEYDGVANIGYIGMNDGVEPTGAFSKRIQFPRTTTHTSFMAGNVGIGTTNPQAKLHVNEGPVYIGDYTGTVTPTEGIFLENAAGNSNTIAMYTYNASVFKIESDGLEANIGWGSSSNREVNFVNTGAGSIKVGIGTTSPTTDFEVKNDSPSGNTTIFVHNNSASHAAMFKARGERTGANSDVSQFLTDNSGKTICNIRGVTDTASTSGRLEFWTAASSSNAVVRMTIDDAGNATFEGDVIVSGDLTVNGTTTTVDTDNLTVKDNNITLNYSTGDSSSVADNAGITIQDAVDASTDASLLWKTASDSFLFSHKIRVPDVEIDGQSLTSSNDLDALNDGFYKWASSVPTNAPTAYMVMYQMTDPNQKIQIAWGSSASGKLYVRRADGGAFYAWAQMLTTASASNTYLPLAGGTLTGDLSVPGIILGSGTSNDIQADGKTAYIGSAIFGDSAATNTPLAPVHIKGQGAPALRIEDRDSTNQVYDFISNQGVGLSIVDQTASITPLVFAHTTGNATFAGTVYTRGATSLVPDATQPGAIILANGGSEASPSTDGRGIEFLTADVNNGYGHRIVSFDNSNGDIPLLLQRRNNNAAWTTQITFEGNSNNATFAGAISASNLSGTNTGDEPNASTTVKGIVELATTAETTTGTDATRAVTPDGLKDGYQGSANVTTLGTISSGTWNGTAIASAYLDADTAHLSGTQTFTGNKTFSGGLGVSSTVPAFMINDSDATNATNQVGYISFQRQSVEKAWIGYGSSGNPNFTIKNTEGAVTIDSNVDVTGTLTATSKSFDIEHPTKEGMRLRYGSLEGPENGVYVRGRMDGEQVIQLPDYWLGLVHEDTITVNLTSIGPGSVWVESIENNTITVGGSEKFFYHVFAERKDIEKLTVEYDV